jgi:hypothetical protein
MCIAGASSAAWRSAKAVNTAWEQLQPSQKRSTAVCFAGFRFADINLLVAEKEVKLNQISAEVKPGDAQRC